MCALEHLPFHLHPTPAGPGITIAPTSTREARAARWRSGAVVAEAAGELWGPEGDAANTWDSDCSTVAMSASDDCDTKGRPDSGSGDSVSTGLTGVEEEEEDTVGSAGGRPGSGSGEDRAWCGLQSPLSQGTLPSPGSTGTLSMGASPWGFKLHNFGQGGTGTSVAYGGDAGDTTESSYPEIRSPEADVRSILPFVGMPTVAEEETGQWDFDVSSVGRW